MGKYKKYYKTLPEGSSEKKERKVDLSKPLKLEKKKLSLHHQKLIDNALILHQRQFKRLSNSSQRMNAILQKHNSILKKKKMEDIVDIFKLIHFTD